MSRPASPPAPRLTLQLVKWSDLIWLPVGLGLLVAGGLTFGLRRRFLGAEASFGLIGMMLIAFGLISLAVGLWWTWKASRAMKVEFGDGVTIARLLGASIRIAWQDVAEVAFHRSERAYQQQSTEGFLFVPIPGVGALTMTTVSTKTRWLIDRYVELRGRDNQPIVRLDRGAMDELAFTLWYERHQLRQVITDRGGCIDWNELGLKRVSRAGTNVLDGDFDPIKQRLLRIRELCEIDLSQSRLTAAALDGLEQCESLESVQGSASSITQDALDKFNSQLSGRRARAGFGFLQSPTAA